jgi:drug/metabolite transporter (DMT)-like permease
VRQALLWLALGFIGNGFAQFLQKYLHASGLGGLQPSALILMYATGTLFGLLLMVGFRSKVTLLEVLFGLGVGVCSYAGNLAVLRALGFLPAYTVFPAVVGGPILTLALLSSLFARQRPSRNTVWGIICGIFAVVLLTS